MLITEPPLISRDACFGDGVVIRLICIMHPYSEGLRRFFQSKTPERFRKSCLKKTFTDLFPINHHVLVNAGHIGEGLLHPTPEVTGVALLPLLLGNNLIWKSRIKIPKLNILTVLQMHNNSPSSWCDSFLPRAVESWDIWSSGIWTHTYTQSVPVVFNRHLKTSKSLKAVDSSFRTRGSYLTELPSS